MLSEGEELLFIATRTMMTIAMIPSKEIVMPQILSHKAIVRLELTAS